jgi:quercetin dioxygenase-like cupin family protein
LWFHALLEIAMETLERLTHRVTVRGGIVVVASLAVLIAGRGPALQATQQTGSKRIDLQRHDLSAPGREVIQVRVDFDPGYASPRHTHPGEEIIYVIEGLLEYEIDGKPAMVKAGDVLFVPAGTVHSAKNVGSGNGAELATYVVEKGKPLITVVK